MTTDTSLGGFAPLRRISLPALEHLFSQRHIRENPPEAGRILTCFTMLSIDIAQGSYEDHQSAHAGIAEEWYQMVQVADLNEDNRARLRKINLEETVHRLWREIRKAWLLGLRGEDLLLRAGSQVLILGFKLLEATDPSDLRWQHLLLRPQDLFPIAGRQKRQHGQRIDLDSISRPLEAECAICHDKIQKGGVSTNCCQQAFDRSCLDAWLNGVGEGATDCCPCCKANLTRH